MQNSFTSATSLSSSATASLSNKQLQSPSTSSNASSNTINAANTNSSSPFYFPSSQFKNGDIIASKAQAIANIAAVALSAFSQKASSLISQTDATSSTAKLPLNVLTDKSNQSIFAKISASSTIFNK